ncbi:Transposase domain [Trinickia caryophylli]|uniref:Transposase domain n=1 Tax=Trinickia caryophylli TaxID=28094 RepID=A0A1X7FMZ7_TRICW|nr:Transposase domain [Trinickia caryophylli]
MRGIGSKQINLKHPLIRLADLSDWERLNAAISASFVSQRGRPTTSTRLIAGLLYLQHAFDLSDEDAVWQWLENPYWQVFIGETYLQTKPPFGPSSLTRWRKRLGEAGVEELLAETIDAAKRANVIKTSSVKRVIADTTVMEKRLRIAPIRAAHFAFARDARRRAPTGRHRSVRSGGRGRADRPYRADSHAEAKGQEQAVRAACSGGRVLGERQSTQAVRIGREGIDHNDAQGRAGRRSIVRCRAIGTAGIRWPKCWSRRRS